MHEDGLWKDEKTRPGPWPQGKRAPLAIITVIVVVILMRVLLPQLRGTPVLGIFIVVIALGGFYTAARLDPERLQQQRYSRGPGWILGLAVSKMPLGVARSVWVLMSCAILALGVLALVGGR